MSPLFDAAVEATKESIVNALCGAEEIVGRDSNVAPVLPLPSLVTLVRRSVALRSGVRGRIVRTQACGSRGAV